MVGNHRVRNIGLVTLLCACVAVLGLSAGPAGAQGENANATGRATPVFEVTGPVSQVAELADGTYVVSGSGKVSVHDRGGGVTGTFDGDGFTVDPDRRKLAIWGRSLLVLSPAEPGPVSVATGEGEQAFGPADFSPDGRAVAYATTVPGGGALAVVTLHDRRVSGVSPSATLRPAQTMIRRCSSCASARAETAGPGTASTGRAWPTDPSPTVAAVEGSSVRVGILGCGNVGSALVQLVADNGDTIAARSGVRLEVVRVAVHNTAKERAVTLSDGVLTHDADALVADPGVDVVVELMGGMEPARRLIRTALEAGKPVVTANKEVLANAGVELLEAAAKAGVDLLYEAAVAGAIPLIRPLRESLAGDRLRRVMGIVNGTTNFILTRMSESGASFGAALAEAQRLGYAERDPTADVEGWDAAAKAAIIASVAFGVQVVAGDVYREGISGITAEDIAMAGRLGYVVKLLAVVEQPARGEVAVRVHPAMVPVEHPLASVRESYNAVFVEGEAAGELMFYGRGAGGRPTASAVLGDLVDAAVNLRQGTANYVQRSGSPPGLARARVRPIDELTSQYYLTIDVVDRPGVLEKVSGVTARHQVSILKLEQVGLGDEARLVLVTHLAAERDVQATIADLRQLDVVDRVGTLLRVVGNE